MRILVAGVGNVLRADDAYGVELARKMQTMDLPKGVTVVETGIGGMALVQELQLGYDALIVADCVDLGRPPGQVMMILPDVIDVHALSLEERMDMLADMHLATPERVFMLSKALGVLPEKLLMVGCQPEDPETPGKPMSETVTRAIDVAIAEILRHIGELKAEDKAARKAAKAAAAAAAEAET
ncbi:MAG: hydrogenase maturation protease [Acidimicrobiales bacterium]